MAADTQTTAPTEKDTYPLEPPFDKDFEYIPKAVDINITRSAGTSQTVSVHTDLDQSVHQGALGRHQNGLALAGQHHSSPRPGSSRADSTNGIDAVAVEVTAKSPAASQQSADIYASLPTVFVDRDDANEQVLRPVKDDLPKFLRQDLDTKRLNDIHSILWMAGRPLAARPLHRHIMLDMRILRTEQADMHILKVSDRLFIKPLPPYLLSFDFWQQNFCPDSPSPEDRALHKRACGLLLSYVWLIRSELDLKIARDEHLVPKDTTWLWWKSFVHNVITDGHLDPISLERVDKRYQWGELRLSRVNTIYRTRFFHTHFIRGYLYGYNRYVVFFQRNFGWMLVIFVYFSLVLSAMQVGVSVPPLQDNVAFQRASYGFVIFAIVLVAAIVGIVGLLFVSIFLINTGLSVTHSLREKRKRKKKAKLGATKQA